MQETQQRGSAWSIKLALILYNIFGYKFIYYLLYPITFFYFLLAGNVKKSLKIYYKHLNLAFNNRVYYEHLRVFAICLVDRFVSKIDPKSYNFIYDNIEVPSAILEKGTVLIYSHFGGWAASSTGAHVKNSVNIVMQEILLDGIKAIENSIEKASKVEKSNVNIIDLNQGSIVVSVQIANALLNEEVVAIMADRASNTKSETEVFFLGEKAKFNKNPFQVAYKVNKPLLVYFIVLVGMKKYKVEYINIDMDQSKKEAEAVAEALNIYVKKFEEIVQKYPNQWFNFYDFWEKK
ncbi:MAG: Lysophospholipid acyltransferase [uncultured Sulfurovum sp.]|uniref:Lysophospholipid acyltransferase n=1 Tax=uncultured Sulfurovum sp. TaxID=269237 RepID=A0A6S6TRB5_9BACT|nr:MAG: Lysophospholipid acyltransferase [uncultured Sulfurovum sp.]